MRAAFRGGRGAGATSQRRALAAGQTVVIAHQNRGRAQSVTMVQQPAQVAQSPAEHQTGFGAKEPFVLRRRAAMGLLVRHCESPRGNVRFSEVAPLLARGPELVLQFLEWKTFARDSTLGIREDQPRKGLDA